MSKLLHVGSYVYDETEAERRLDAYIEMLKTVYGLDEYGLADMLEMKHQTWTKYRRASFGQKGATTTFMLAQITGISVSWLFCEEQVDDEGEAI